MAQEAFEVGVLGSLHQSEMPIRQRERGIAAQGSEHRHARLRARLPEQLRVPAAAHSIEHDPLDLDIGPKTRKAVNHRRGGGRHRARVHDEQHRPAGGRRDIGGRALVRGRPVEKAHDPFRNDQLRLARGGGDCGGEGGSPHRPGIQVEAGPAARGGVKGGVDVIRSHLERGDPHPGVAEMPQQRESDGRLAAPRGRGGDHQSAVIAGASHRTRGHATG